MSIVLIGLSHKTAPIEMRERLAFSDSLMPEVLSSLVNHDEVDEGLIVSTCNRVEIVAAAPADAQRSITQLTHFLCDFHHFSPAALHPHLYALVDTEAVKHVFRVASSLDSIVVGEPQILGQVKDAYKLAAEVGTIGRILSQLMQRTLSVAKRIRTETAISENPVSVSSVAVDLAKKVFDSLAEKTVLLVGAGEMGRLAAQNLLAAGAGKLIVTNRTAERAEALAREFHGGAVNFEAFYDVLPAADIILCSTGAAEYTIQAEEVRRALKSRRRGRVLFIDISVPRNIDPAVAKTEGCFLFDVDDLDAVVKANRREREREAERAEFIIESEVQQFAKHLRALDMGPRVQEVKELLSQMALAELKRNRKRLGELSLEQEQALQTILIPALVNKLSHPLILHLRSVARDGDADEVLHDIRKMLRID